MRYGDIPERGGTMACSVYGPKHGVYSADRGDYFTRADADEVAECSECGAPMELGREATTWVRDEGGRA